MTGRLTRLPEGKSFGFIRGEDNKDYFFHKGSLSGFWEDLVTDFETSKTPIELIFDPTEGPKGKRAENVKRVDWPNQST